MIRRKADNGRSSRANCLPGVERLVVSIVVPVYNEVATVERCLERVARLPLAKEVIVVDDGSTDGTRSLLAELEERGLVDRLLLHDENRGKGASLRTGIRHATGDVVAVQDADLEYDPRDLPALVAPIARGEADAVFGSRLSSPLYRERPKLYSAANTFLTLASNLFHGLGLTDLGTCYKVVRTDLLRTLPLRANRFGFDPEIIGRLAQAGARVRELPISYRPRGRDAGKKIGWKDAVAALWYVVRSNFQGRRATRLRTVVVPHDAGDARTSSGDASGRLPPKSGELSLVHRLAVAYLLAPVAVWLLGWFHWWAGVPATALLAVGAWQALQGSWRWRRPSRTTVVLALVAGLWVVTTPAGGVFAVGADWSVHRAMLLDLIRDGWPTYPVDYLNDSSPMVRYYLGWHMVPALLGRWLGPAALSWAVPLWTWCGTTLVVLLFARGLPTLRAALVAVAVLVLFSGMDLVETVLREGVPDAARMLRDTLDPTWVVPPGRNRLFEFIRTSTSPMFLEYLPLHLVFSTTPQHFLPAGLATLLMLQLRGHRRFLSASGVVIACCLFWSPIVALSLLLAAAMLLVKNPNARHVASWQNVFVAVPLAALIALYLTSGDLNFGRGWLWEFYDDHTRMATDVLVFYAAEFMVVAALLWRLDPRAACDPMFLVAVPILMIVPWYWYGPLWDTALHRLTVPALIVLAYYAARAVATRPDKLVPGPAYRALLGVLAVGAASTAWAIGLGLHQRPGFLRYETLGHSLLTHTPPRQARQKTTYAVRPELRALLRNHNHDPARRKGTLLIRSAWDVYLRDNLLVYVKQHCSRGDGVARTRFYVDVHPTDPHALPAGSAEVGTERLAFGLIPWKHYKEGGGCVIPVELPDYDIARITTGQTGPDGDAIWEAEAHLRPR